jgi:predicted Zn-dependent peptidase
MNYLNTIKSLTLLILLSVVSFRAVAQDKPVEVYKLPNGLTVILQEDHRRPEVQGIVVTRAGSINEDPNFTGIAHYLEHMLFKGTKDLGTTDFSKEEPHYSRIIQLYDNLGKTTNKKEREAIQKEINEESLKAAEFAVPNELQRLVDEIGGTGLNAGTGYDNTSYYSKFPSSQLERWLKLYAHLFGEPVFRSFQAELETIYEEYNMYADQFQSRMREEIMKTLFKKTPYGRSVIGLPDHLKNPSISQMQKFYKTYYVPENMGLVLVGDFDTGMAKQYIESYFGMWESGKTEIAKFEEEAPFKGREFLELKMGPQNIININFRTAPASHEDDMILDICSSLLSNGQSGLLDQLTFDNKVLSASGGNSALRYGGIFSFYIVPNAQEFYDGPSTTNIVTYDDYKAVMREMDRAQLKAMPGSEEMVMDEIERLKDGDFGDWQLESAKEQMILGYTRQQESVTSKALMLSHYFGNEIDLSFYTNYVEKIKQITKDDVLRVAKKYFGKNYLTVYVKPGSLKKNNIDKPEYKPLVFPQADATSAFAKEFISITTPEQKFVYIDFDKDVEKIAMSNGNEMYYTKNPVNDIFSLTIRYKVGTNTIKELDYVSMLNFAGAAARDAKGLKGQFARLNCSYSVSANDNYVYVSMSGPEDNLRQATTYLGLFINETALANNQMSRLAQSERISRQYEKEEPAAISDALASYIIYGEKSDYLDRLPIKDLMNVKARDLVTAFKMATEYEATIFYTGAKSPTEIKATLEQNIKFAASPKKGAEYKEREKQKVAQNEVFMINNQALQSQIRFFSNGQQFKLEDAPIISAFNNYLSGGFTGLVMQEIREYRSLAYGAGGGYSTPMLTANPGWFSGVIQTQDDKTAYATEVFMSLISDMPQKPNRIDVLKNKLVLSSATTRPDFRQLGMTIDSWKFVGYTEDPLKTILPAYQALRFEDIVKFENDYIKSNPMAIMIVGPKKRIDTKLLSKYGKVKELKLSDIFSKDEE